MRFYRVHCAVALAAGLLIAGCSKQSASGPESVKEVKGEPINVTPATPQTTAATEKANPAATAQVAAKVTTPAPAATPAVPVPAPAPAAKATAEDDFAEIGFDLLAGFNYEMPDESSVSTNAPAKPAKEQIPDTVKVMDKKRVALKGFMLPLKVEGGLITELLIMRDQSMCCYGNVPRINEWVSVKMVNKGVKPVMDQPITLYGALKVGEMYENGYLVGIYEMAGEKMTEPLDL